ncbi:type I secretion system ATPase [Asticcacaulis excentricus]|uniref:Type I secretion system ATPase n=1 Tax=Asticcacaulis excentricus TaxID=78587 RepID=A0A3G9GAA6_9CAUL|nr:type I secretion system ATPase [Asticcacaulis excentricus]
MFDGKDEGAGHNYSLIRDALEVARPAFIAAGVFSLFITLLMLTGSLYMLEVYDRVIPSHSVPTLLAVTFIVLILYGFQSLLEGIRSRLFARIGRQFDDGLKEAVFLIHARSGLPAVARSGEIPAYRDLDQLRSFLASPAVSVLFDLPVAPIFLILMFLLHPLIGLLGVLGIILLAGITWLTERATKPLQKNAAERMQESSQQIEAARQAAETLFPLGMADPLKARWSQKHHAAGDAVILSADSATHYGGMSRFVRMSLQSLTLGLGAWLVIHGDASGGVMIASSILLGRALAPVELAIGHWRAFVNARQAYGRLSEKLSTIPLTPTTELPPPSRELRVENLYVAAPGADRRLILNGIKFELSAGDALGIIGPSGSGKSTLARALMGVWPIAQGTVRLDGAELKQWHEATVGRFFGYLPQEVDLFAGTFAENISRFQPDATSEKILKAAQMADIETFIKGFEQGFDTDLGPRGSRLSIGQRQRVGLARALYGDPFLILLDEPNSALDAEGEKALLTAVANARRRGAIVIMIAHRPKMLQVVNKVVVLANGQQKAFGPREEILRQVMPESAPARPQPAGAKPLSVVKGAQGE